MEDRFQQRNVMLMKQMAAHTSRMSTNILADLPSAMKWVRDTALGIYEKQKPCQEISNSVY